MQKLSDLDVIQALQEFRLDSGLLLSKIYTDFDSRMINRAAQKWLLSNELNIVVPPSGR